MQTKHPELLSGNLPSAKLANSPGLPSAKSKNKTTVPPVERRVKVKTSTTGSLGPVSPLRKPEDSSVSRPQGQTLGRRVQVSPKSHTKASRCSPFPQLTFDKSQSRKVGSTETESLKYQRNVSVSWKCIWLYFRKRVPLIYPARGSSDVRLFTLARHLGDLKCHWAQRFLRC